LLKLLASNPGATPLFFLVQREGTAALIAARASDARYPPIFMFPEGTTSNGHCLLQFQRGAFVAGVPIIPVLLNYKYKVGWRSLLDVL
jgi:1-acyl-sn-glycerol-3-phosphate acyltransferase